MSRGGPRFSSLLADLPTLLVPSKTRRNEAMTDALRRAFEAAGRLPEQDQNELAAAILEELAADERWEAALAGSQGAPGTARRRSAA
jgi:hypothetical protein